MTNDEQIKQGIKQIIGDMTDADGSLIEDRATIEDCMLDMSEFTQELEEKFNITMDRLVPSMTVHDIALMIGNIKEHRAI
ncbi:MAG: hypothetical protein PHQ95_04315 [Candidatus Gracilibacteria bacterium]|nr:hypothetical protein [Candidatus Gracilibacteria bacterium]